MLFSMKTLKTIIVFSIFSQTLINARQTSSNKYNECMDIMKRLCNVASHKPSRIHCEKGAILNYRLGGYVPETEVLLPEYIHEYFQYLYKLIYFPSNITTPSDLCEGRIGDAKEKYLTDMAEFLESPNFKYYTFFNTNLESIPETSHARHYLEIVSDSIYIKGDILEQETPYMYCYRIFVEGKENV